MQPTTLWRFIAILAIAWAGWSEPAMAQVGGNIDEEDLSSQLMARIFGGAWYGMTLAEAPQGADTSDTGVMGAVSLVLNLGVLACVAWLVGLSAMSAAMSAAHAGVAMSQKYNTLWVPLRQALSISMIAPVIGGVSLVQAAILFMASLGITVVNTGYTAALQFIETNTLVSAMPVPQLDEIGRTALRQAFCVSVLEDHGKIQRASITGETSLESALRGLYELNQGNRYYHTGWRYDETGRRGETALCGSYRMSYDAPITPGPTAQQARNRQTQLAMEKVAAMGRLQNNLKPLAERLAAGESPPATELWTHLRSYHDELRAAGISYATDLNNQARGQSDTRSSSMMDVMDDRGWLYMGAYYWNLQRYTTASLAALDNLGTQTGPLDGNADGQGSKITPRSLDREYQRKRQTLEAYLQNAPTDAGLASASDAMEHAAAAKGTESTGVQAMVSDALEGLGSPLRNMAKSTLETVAGGGDPVGEFQKLGFGIIRVAYGAYIAQLMGRVAADVATNNLAGRVADFVTGSGTAINTVVEDITSLVSLVAVGLLILGVFMAYVIPALPFTMFMIAALGWMLSVVKGFIAAPIWMAAHSLPDGEGWAGTQARNGYMLVFSIVLRPILMLMGYLAATLVLGAISIAIAAIGPLAMDSIQGGNVFGVLSMVMFLGIFAVLLFTVATRCFALSYEVPDEVLKWIGGGVETLGDTENNRNMTMAIAGFSNRVEHGAGAALGLSRKPNDGQGKDGEGQSSTRRSDKKNIRAIAADS